jgi:hypothetical protein
MKRTIKLFAALLLFVALALGAGYALPRPARGGDVYDAVAAVQRHSPHFLIGEPPPPPKQGRRTVAVYLSRTPMTVADIERLRKGPDRGGRDWEGVACFKDTTDPAVGYIPWVTDGGECCLRFRTFAVYGDPAVLREVRAILAAAGHRLDQ